MTQSKFKLCRRKKTETTIQKLYLVYIRVQIIEQSGFIRRWLHLEKGFVLISDKKKVMVEKCSKKWKINWKATIAVVNLRECRYYVSSNKEDEDNYFHFERGKAHKSLKKDLIVIFESDFIWFIFLNKIIYGIH